MRHSWIKQGNRFGRYEVWVRETAYLIAKLTNFQRSEQKTIQRIRLPDEKNAVLFGSIYEEQN